MVFIYLQTIISFLSQFTWQTDEQTGRRMSTASIGVATGQASAGVENFFLGIFVGMSQKWVAVYDVYDHVREGDD